MKPPPQSDDEPRRLEIIARYSVKDSSAEPALDELATLAAQICETPLAFVSIVEEQRQSFKSRVGSNLTEIPRHISFCGHTIAQKHLLVVPDATRDERFHDNPLVAAEPRIRFYAGAPLVSPEGLALGTLCVMDRVPRELRPHQRLALEILARQAMAQLELRRRSDERIKAGTEESLRQANRALHTIGDCNQAMIRATDEAELLSTVCRIVVDVGGYRLAWVGYAEEDDYCSVRPVAQAGFEKGYLETLKISWADVERGRGPTGTAIRTGQPALARNLFDDPAFAPWREEALKRDFASALGLPLIVGGKSLGALTIYSAVSNAFDAAETALLSELAGDLAYGIEALRTKAGHRRAEDELRESQSRLQLATQASNIGLWDWNFDTNEVYLSPEWKDQLGYADAEISNRLDEWQSRLHPDDRVGTLAALKAYLEEGGPANFETEFRLRHKNGSYRWIYTRAQLLRDGAGRPARLTGCHVDVTQHKQLEEQFRHVQKMEAIGQLAGGVAHDFNNLLTVIQGNASLLQDAKYLSEQDVGLIRQITGAAERAAGLTRQLLLFGRKQVLQPFSVNLNEVVGNLTKMLQRILGEDITFQSDFAPNLPPVRVDVGMIEQIILNLAVNARDAMPRGGQLRIRTAMEAVGEGYAPAGLGMAPGTCVCMEVRDTGCGIAPEHLPHIFEPFFTTKEVGKGTGLGLATVYSIVKQHRGEIEVASEVNQGTTFRICLPADTSPPVEPKIAPADFKWPAGNETILVVEDESAVRLLVSNQLQRCGYTVLSSPSGPAALPVWEQHKDSIQLLLTDVIMPGGMTGRELAERLRSEKPLLKVIYTSGYSTEVLGKAVTLMEGFNFLQKPYQFAKLARAVRDCLDEK